MVAGTRKGSFGPARQKPDRAGREQYSLGGKSFSQEFRVLADFERWWPVLGMRGRYAICYAETYLEYGGRVVDHRRSR